MKTIGKILILFAVLHHIPGIPELLSDKETLREQLVRVHIVAASDSSEDQNIKLKVRDAVLNYLEEYLPKEISTQEAQKFLSGHLTDIEEIANEILMSCGSKDSASVSLEKEAFPVRHYETFSLPSGIYKALKVRIGTGEGKNWWCVAFPSLCRVTTADMVKNVAVDAGFSDNLTNTVTLEEGYEIRFFFLDCLGKIENLFHFG